MSIYVYSKRGRGNQAIFNIKKNGIWILFFSLSLSDSNDITIQLLRRAFQVTLKWNYKPLYISTVKMKVEARYSNHWKVNLRLLRWIYMGLSFHNWLSIKYYFCSVNIYQKTQRNQSLVQCSASCAVINYLWRKCSH